MIMGVCGNDLQVTQSDYSYILEGVPPELTPYSFYSINVRHFRGSYVVLL